MDKLLKDINTISSEHLKLNNDKLSKFLDQYNYRIEKIQLGGKTNDYLYDNFNDNGRYKKFYLVKDNDKLILSKNSVPNKLSFGVRLYDKEMIGGMKWNGVYLPLLGDLPLENFGNTCFSDSGIMLLRNINGLKVYPYKGNERVYNYKEEVRKSIFKLLNDPLSNITKDDIVSSITGCNLTYRKQEDVGEYINTFIEKYIANKEILQYNRTTHLHYRIYKNGQNYYYPLYRPNGNNYIITDQPNTIFNLIIPKSHFISL